MKPSNTPTRETDDDLIASGTAVGIWMMEGIKERVDALDQRSRILLYTAMLKVPIGCMKQSVGVDAARAILDVSKENLGNG